jgi:RES domain-containing protein
VRWSGTCYRAHDPRWAWSPVSGEGARVNGGRFNPQGTPALYFAMSIEGMLLEMTHGFAHRFEPLTVCTYLVDVDNIVDLRNEEACANEGVLFTELGCAWAFELAKGRCPPSWEIARKFIDAGASGIIVPSYATGARSDMSNLVLWKWGSELPLKVEVFDPNSKLPRNSSSWESI